MSVLTAIRPFSKKTVVPVETPPMITETPRQEILRLLDRAVHERGVSYIDHTHTPIIRRNDGSLSYGCIVGYILGLKGVPVERASQFNVYFERFGWNGERHLLESLIQNNDHSWTWGRIRELAIECYPVAI